MFKIISTELKKIVARPGIYILSVLLAIILILGAFIYKPKVYETTNYTLNGNTFIEKYTDFYPSNDAGKKVEAKQNLNNAIKAVQSYRIASLTQKENIQSLLDKFNESYATYQDCSSDENYSPATIKNCKDSVVSDLEKLNAEIESAINNTQISYTIVTSEENYNNYLVIYKEVHNWAGLTVEQKNLRAHFAEFENKYSNTFFSCFENFKYPHISDDFIKTYTTLENNTKYSILNKRLSEIDAEIEQNKTQATNEPKFNLNNADKMDELANKYTNTINTYTSLIKYELLVNAFNSISTSEELTTLYLKDHSNFNSKSLLVRFNYLFEHNKSEEDFAKPLTIGVTSNHEINAYDYAYFVLRVFSFVIIIYAIMSACFSISGEIKEGSMRYLAIRPVSRTKLFWGKWLAIILMSIILLVFSFIISLCVGFAVYGASSNTILTIFNGSKALTLHPVMMVVIYLISMFFEIVIYSLIAMLFSALFKSDLMSSTILIVLLLLNTIMPIFIEGTNSWLTYYVFSHISIYSLFGSSVYAVPQNFFNKVFGAKVYAGTHAALTFGVIALLIIIVSALAVKIFKKKEL